MSAIVTLFPTIRIERYYEPEDCQGEKPRRLSSPADVLSLLDARMKREFDALREACERRPCDGNGDDAA